MKLVKELNLPHVRMPFDVYHEQVMRGNLVWTITEAYMSVFRIADNPGRNNPGTSRGQLPQREQGDSEDLLQGLYWHGMNFAVLD